MIQNWNTYKEVKKWCVSSASRFGMFFIHFEIDDFACLLCIHSSFPSTAVVIFLQLTLDKAPLFPHVFTGSNYHLRPGILPSEISSRALIWHVQVLDWVSTYVNHDGSHYQFLYLKGAIRRIRNSRTSLSRDPV